LPRTDPKNVNQGMKNYGIDQNIADARNTVAGLSDLTAVADRMQNANYAEYGNDFRKGGAFSRISPGSRLNLSECPKGAKSFSPVLARSDYAGKPFPE
jgi:hypothetical protein